MAVGTDGQNPALWTSATGPQVRAQGVDCRNGCCTTMICLPVRWSRPWRLTAVMVLTSIAIVWCHEGSAGVYGDEGESSAPKPIWRYTRFGWDDASDWYRAAAPTPNHRFIHPLGISLLLLFAVLWMVFWAAEEDELERLWRFRSSSYQRKSHPPSDNPRKNS